MSRISFNKSKKKFDKESVILIFAIEPSGSSSVVELHVANVVVASSNLVSRSILL